MNEETVQFNRVDLSDRLLDWASDIDVCHRVLSLISENIDDKNNEHCAMLLVIEKLCKLQGQVNEFETQNL